jgi:hypothetical protein
VAADGESTEKQIRRFAYDEWADCRAKPVGLLDARFHHNGHGGIALRVEPEGTTDDARKALEPAPSGAFASGVIFPDCAP